MPVSIWTPRRLPVTTLAALGWLAAQPAIGQDALPASPGVANVQRGNSGPPGEPLTRPPTDAEKISRLQQSIEVSRNQVDTLTGKLNDPDSEFNQAESAFLELDRRLGEIKKELEAPGAAPRESRKQELENQLAEIGPRHKLAKDRFDLAIRERKTLQEQIRTLQQKIDQDTEALKRLKGEGPPASQPDAAAAPVSQPQTSSTAASPAPPFVSPSVQPAAAAPALPAGVPAAGAAPPAARTAPPALSNPPDESPSAELVAAREKASARQAEAQSAKAEVASIGDRVAALQKNIDLERQLLDTNRKKVANAQATERSLYDTLQKKWQEGASQDELADLQTQIAAARDRVREAQDETRSGNDRLGKYQAELASLQAEQIAALQSVRKKEAEASKARDVVQKLESPLAPHNLLRWVIQRGPRALGIILAMIVLLVLVRFGDKRLIHLLTLRGSAASVEDRENRARTLVGVFHSTAAAAIYTGGFLMILTEIGVDIVPLMGGAAVVGLAVAFGAQNLIRDYFYGFMILLEQQYGINDVVKIGDVAGQVEHITLRLTVLRDLDGTVHFVPNGEIKRVSNMTHQWSRALFDIPVAYKEDVDRVMSELIELAKELRRDPEFRGLILEMPEMLGVDSFGDSAVVIKFLIKTRPLKQWIVKRELLRRIKRRFDELGIEIPFPHRTVYHHYNGNCGEPLSGAAAGEDPLDRKRGLLRQP